MTRFPDMFATNLSPLDDESNAEVVADLKKRINENDVDIKVGMIFCFETYLVELMLFWNPPRGLSTRKC